MTEPEIKQVLDFAEEAAYTPGELAAYDQYWDAISIEKTLVSDAHEKGVAIGFEEGEVSGLEKGIIIGVGKGEQRAKQALASRLLAKGMRAEEIATLTELPLIEIRILAENKMPQKM